MKEPFTFYRAFDAVRGSWDGYGSFTLSESDFLAYVADAPSGASIHTPEVIHTFWSEFCRTVSTLGPLELADAINRMQVLLQNKSKQEAAIYQSTLSLACKIGATLHYFSIGDSTLQVLRENKLYRLSQSEAWDGAMILDAATKWRERTKLGPLQFIGNGGQYIPATQISQFELRQNDLLVLHTDGFEDLLSPEKVISVLKLEPDQRRLELERIFQKERLKDDVTLLTAELEVAPAFDAAKELSVLQSQVTQLRKEQQHFREDLSRIGLSQNRVEKMERALQEIGRQVQQLAHRPEPSRTFAPTTGAVSITRTRRNITIPWPWILAGFATGAATVLALFFLFRDKTEPANVTPNSPRQRVAPAPTEEKRSVSPPEILAPQDCEYIVQKGDSLQKIAQQRDTTVDQLVAWNPSLRKDAPLQVGQELNVCGELP